MFPNLFPEFTVTNKVQKPLYSLLKRQLPNNFTIFSSIKWTVNHSNSRHQETQADCIIISPCDSILVLKIIEGDISYNQGNWYNNNHLISDPFQQAIETKYSLLQYLKEHDFGSDKPIVISEAVAFPDVSIDHTFGLNIPQTLILDQPQLFNLRNWVQSVISYGQNQQQVQVIFDQEKMEQNQYYKPLIELSQEQLGLLEFLNHNHRVSINGCSDSGNILLAIEKVNRLHQKGLSVLVITYQRSLTKYIGHRLGERENLQINDCYELSKIIIKKALNHDINFKEYSNKKVLVNEILPTLMIRAIDKIDFSFDAIIVTQGHKFNELWWLALKELLKEPEQGHFYLFQNTSQKRVRKNWNFPLKDAPYCLINNRNNSQILYDCSQELEQQNSM